GDVHNKSQINNDALAMQNRYTDNGYINARVVPQVTLDKAKKTTHVVHQVREGELKYIREIDITGNSVTKDEVIRRQILLRPGERFDGSKLRISEDRLNATQYFEGIRLRREDEEENDRFTNLLVDVDEGKTGTFNFGGAFNTDEGVAGFGELRLSNFDITNWPSLSGGGQEFTTRFTIGSIRTNLRVGFTDPEFAGYPISVGVDLFNERFRSRGGTSFTQKTQGGQLRLGKRLSNFVTANATIRITDVEISDLDTFVNPALRELEDPESTASLTLGLTRNTANNFRDPTGGSRHTINVEVAGFGLANDFVKVNHDSIWYYGFKRRDKLSFSFRTREGIAFPYGDKEFLPLQDRYFTGGSSTLRGYDFRDVGPKAKTFLVIAGEVFVDEEAIGAEFRLLNTLEAKYKLNELVRLYTFVDSGGAWLVPEDFSFGDFKYSVGVGLGLQVPFLGPLRIDYGIPLNPDSDQGSGQLHFQSSLRF
ncbi:MAG: BamA/TamA family outer membrane protein, partial [Candidatus Hydrogenedentes bacterium]|nr:BamA/TamA family outer membrane protein [Candidatus Hydrogenedentota bacterium]